MTRVAVAPYKMVRGYDGIADLSQFSKAFVVTELEHALMRVYNTDAHMVTYVVPGWDRQPRINKCGLPHFEPTPQVEVLLCDVDNPDHQPWAPELIDATLKKYETLDVLKTAGLYHTAHGARIMQPLETPIPVDQVEPYIVGWLMDLEWAGLHVDWACRDWTRLFRLPNVQRDEKLFVAPYIDIERMRPVTIRPADTQSRKAPTPAVRPLGSVKPIQWRDDVPEHWQNRVQSIADVVCAVESEWHTLFMATSGAPLERGVAYGQLPALVRAISHATKKDTRTEDREMSARTTAENCRLGNPITGYSNLQRRWPEVAKAIDVDSAASDDTEPLDLVCGCSNPEDLEAAIRDAPDGLTLIAAECGLGKTAAAIRVAAQRASKDYTDPTTATGKRAPAQSKTAISVDKNALAIQVVGDLATEGVAAKRIFGPLSLKDDNGTPVCKLHEVAAPLVAGGQAMQWEICQGRHIDPCEHYDTCPARDGMSGPRDARVIIGPHALIGKLNGAAGKTGLLIIDEPPDLLESIIITPDELATTREMLHNFDSRYGSAIAPALEALCAWTEKIAVPNKPALLTEAITEAAKQNLIDDAVLERARKTVGAECDPIDYALAARFPDRHSFAPPVQHVYLRMSKSSVSYAIKLGAASRVLGALYYGLTPEGAAAVRVEESNGRRVLVLVTTRDQLVRALCREGAAVAMDATIEIHAEIYAKVVGYEPPLLRYTAGDGAKITRVLVRTKGAVRKYWLPKGKLNLDSNLPRALQTVLELAEHADSIGLITMLPVELAIRAALRPEDKEVDSQWQGIGQDPSALKQAREILGPIVRRFNGEIFLGHYGAVRGLNNMMDVDCLVTLGDPWPNLGAVQNEVAFLQLQKAWTARLVAQCRAELEQAHGRLRAVHRTREGMAIHVGKTIPGGTGWQKGEVKVVELKKGRPRNNHEMSKEEFQKIVDALGGVRATSRVLGCSHTSIRRFVSGERAVPKAITEQLSKIVHQGCIGNVA
ncbi:MAG: hypothetical protein GY854_01530 [Deltaproteobacteria bacterium]|nr:hypothetical protein [Deltaproteobacteria bacterium]